MTDPPLPDQVWLSGERRVAAEAVAVALVVGVVHLVFRLSAAFLTGALDDDGVYVALGKAIADGSGYRSIHLVGEPVQVRYPPGLPALLAIPWALGGSLGAVRATVGVANLVATAGAAGLLWWIGRRRLGVSPWPLAVCAVSPFVLDATIQYYNIPLSEPYLALGWAAALVLVAPLAEPNPTAARGLGRAAAVGLVLAATALFRTAGIALVPAVVLALALHRRWAAAAACAAAALLPLGAWGALRATWVAHGPVSSFPDDLGYWAWLGVQGPVALAAYAGQTLAANAVEYVPKLASYLISSQALGAVVVVVALVSAGWAGIRLRRAHTALVLTALFASALTLLWPFTQGRLLLPLLPVLGLLVASTVELGCRRTPRRRVWAFHAGLGLLAAAVILRQVELRRAAGRAYQTGVMPPPENLSPTLTLAVRSRFIYQVAEWLERHTTRDDRVMVSAPAGVFLHTGRRTVPAAPTESRLARSVFAVPGRYLAERLVADSVTMIVVAPPAPGLEGDIVAVTARCPHVLVRHSASPPVPAYFKVTRDAGCLRARLLGGDTSGASMPPTEPRDAVGAATLERMAAAPRYNRWMYERLHRWIGSRVLEIGSGIGNLSAFIAERERVVLTDTEPYYLERLRERFGDRPNVEVATLRLPTVDGIVAAERFDTIMCLNVLEHIEDDLGSLAAMAGLLRPGGRLVLLVPALRWLYGALDAALGHYRRYTPAELSAKLRATGFTVRHREYFNLAGVPGWWVTGRVLKRRVIPTGSLRLYDALVPLFRWERVLPWRVGQSLIAIGEREV